MAISSSTETKCVHEAGLLSEARGGRTHVPQGHSPCLQGGVREHREVRVPLGARSPGSGPGSAPRHLGPQFTSLSNGKNYLPSLRPTVLAITLNTPDVRAEESSDKTCPLPLQRRNPLTRGSGPPKGLLAHHRASGLVVDVEVASCVPQQRCGLLNNIPAQQGSGQRGAGSPAPPPQV